MRREVWFALFSAILNTSSVLRFIIKTPQVVLSVPAFFSFLSREVAEVASSLGPRFSVVTGQVALLMAILVLGLPRDFI